MLPTSPDEIADIDSTDDFEADPVCIPAITPLSLLEEVPG